MAFREYTIKLLEAIQEGLIDRDTVITAALQHMSEAEVRDMCESEGWFDAEEDEDADPAGPDDLSDDAEVLASAGMGTDEDYGCFGGDGEW
jgi:hypothetical protein